MKKKGDFVVAQVRSFSRFYTNILGLLNQGILDSPYSLTEVRILLEIDKTKNCTAIALTDKLDIDRGYLSRILSRFESDGMIIKKDSPSDGRMALLYLTSRGKKALSMLEQKSDDQIKHLIKYLNEDERERLVDAMKYIMKSLSYGASPVKIRTYQTKDVEYIIKRHREIYKDEYGFSSEFGDYVEKYVYKFDEHHDEDKENIWIAEADGKNVGMIAIVKADDSTSQLRWFLIEPEMRGKGLGHELVKTAVDFCREKGYKHVFLWTVNILETARHIYKQHGFELTETVDNNTWTDRTIKEERWDLYL